MEKTDWKDYGMSREMDWNRVWKLLEIEPTDSKREIRRAYASCLKKYHPEEEPQKFEIVKEAYERALEYCNNPQKYTISNDMDMSGEMNVNGEEDRNYDTDDVWENEEEEWDNASLDYEDTCSEDEVERDRPLLDKLSKLTELQEEKNPLCETVMERIYGIMENQSLREDGGVWAKLFLEWEFLDVQLNVGFANSLKEYLEKQENIPEALLVELMVAYDLEPEREQEQFVVLDLFKNGEVNQLLKGAMRVIAELWNEQEEGKREYLQREYLEKPENGYRQGYFHEYHKVRFLFEKGLLIEGQEKLWENALWHGNPENIAIWKEDIGESVKAKEDYLPILYAYLVERYEIPEFICRYFYREYRLYFLTGSRWEDWYIPLREAILKRYPELEDRQFEQLAQELGEQKISKAEQIALMLMINPFMKEEAEEQRAAYDQIMKMLQQKQEAGDYTYYFYLFAYCVERMSAHKFKNTGLTYVVRLVTYMKSYLFALPHLEYPEKVRKSFFKSLWSFYYYFDENKRKIKFEFYGQEELLLHCESTRIPAILSVWDLDYLPNGICSHCGKSLPQISFTEGKKKTVKREIVEEWDVYEVAKSLTRKSKKNFDIYKKVSKLYGYRICEYCGGEETFLDTYMNWWYENTPWKRPNKELLAWLFQEMQEVSDSYEGRRQQERYCKFLMDYLYESKDWDRTCVAEYFWKMKETYHFEDEKKEKAYYLEKTKEMLDIVLGEEELDREQRKHFSVLKADIMFEQIRESNLPFEEAEKEWNFVIDVYDDLFGPGNLKSVAVYKTMAFSLAYNCNQKYNPERAIEIFLEQLEVLEEKNPNESECIGRIQEAVAFVYRDKLKDYEAAIPYYEEYLRYIEDAYGKESDYASDERTVFYELCEMAEKKKRKEAMAEAMNRKKNK